MAKQLGIMFVGFGILFLAAGFLIGNGGITANVAGSSMGTFDYLQASLIGLSIVALTAGIVFFRVGSGK